MATTSSLSSTAGMPAASQPAVWLRRREKKKSALRLDAWKRFSLFDAERLDGRLSIAQEGTVTVSEAYDIAIDLAGLGAVPGVVDVNGEEIVLGPQAGQALLDDHAVSYFSPMTDSGLIFSGIYGYARISLSVQAANGSACLLSTSDIPTMLPGKHDAEVGRVQTMLGTIMGPDGDKVADLMFAGGARLSERFSIIEGGYRNASGRSLNTYLHVVEEVVTGFERIGSALAAQSRTVVVREPMMVGGEAARTFGRKEVEWVSQNADVLQVVHRQTAIEIKGKYYLPRRIETSRLTRSYDAYENESIFAFVNHMLGTLSAIESALDQQVLESDRISRVVGSAKEEEGYVLSALIVEESKAELSRSSLRQVEDLQRRVTSFSRFLQRMWPDIKVSRSGFRRPRRTRAFQELSAYKDAYRLMETYLDTGDCTLEREGLVLHTLRLDRIYEYYALAQLLDALIREGFEADDRYGAPSENFAYSLQDRNYRNETRVANTYHLVRGDTRVDLYYQPVLYGDDREENGISLHRTTGWLPFEPVRQSGRTPYWTPDYLLVVHDQQGMNRVVVLDAKYSRTWSVIDRRPAEPYSGEALLRSRFGACLRKYLLETASSRPGDARPALWLLCGREDEAIFMPYEAGWGLYSADNAGVGGDAISTDGHVPSPWAQRTSFTPSGVLSLGPEANGLDRLLSILGLCKSDTDLEKSGTGLAESGTEAEEEQTAFPSEPEQAKSSVEPEQAGPSAEPEQVERPAALEQVESSLVSEQAEPSAEPEQGAALSAVSQSAYAEHAPLPQQQSEAVVQQEAVATEVAEPTVTSVPSTHPQEPIPQSEPDSVAAIPLPTPSMPDDDAREKKAKPAKKKEKKPKRDKKPKQGRTVQRATFEYMPLIEKIYASQSEQVHLFGQLRWCEHPILRAKEPAGREAKFYTPIELDGEQLFVYSNWNQLTFSQLKRWADRLDDD